MKVNQDSRAIKKGEWFVAVKGEKFDGHDFVHEALRKGAAGILEEEELYQLAGERIVRIRPKVIAVTGSYGKTTTKEVIAKVLSRKFKVLKTSGNLNTSLGIALEIVNKLKPWHKVLVAELGMDRLGEIAQSCYLIKPEIGVITSVGEMHLAKLGTLENIKSAKAELLRALPGAGTAVLNLDDASVREISLVFRGKKIWYGLAVGANIGPAVLKGVRLPLLGKGGFLAALAAYAVGDLFGLGSGEIQKALIQMEPLWGRLHVLRKPGGITVIDDTYNAGPSSVAEALEVLKGFPALRRIAILGDMLELGSQEGAAHLRAVAQAAKSADIFIPVGKRMVCAAIKLGGRTTNLDQLELKRGDVVLVKGSRAMKMEEIVKNLVSLK